MLVPKVKPGEKMLARSLVRRLLNLSVPPLAAKISTSWTIPGVCGYSGATIRATGVQLGSALATEPVIRGILRIAFGAGPHFCAGAWASRAMVASVALPSVFARLNNLRLDPSQEVKVRGWAFRGVLNLPCEWITN